MNEHAPTNVLINYSCIVSWNSPPPRGHIKLHGYTELIKICSEGGQGLWVIGGMVIDLRLTIRRSVLLGGLAVPIPLSKGDALSVVSGDILPEEISSMLWRRSWDDEDDLLSSSTVSCGEAGSNVLSSCSDCESICDSAVNIYIKFIICRRE